MTPQAESGMTPSIKIVGAVMLAYKQYCADNDTAENRAEFDANDDRFVAAIRAALAPSEAPTPNAYKPGPLRLAFIRGINAANNDPVTWTREQAMEAAKLAYPDTPVTEPRLVQSAPSEANPPDHAQDFLRAGWAFLDSIANGSVCSDRSCLRCRIADALFDVQAATPPRTGDANG